MNENEHEEEQDVEVPNIERLRNIPTVNPEEPFHEILTELKGIRAKVKPTSKTGLHQKELIAEYISFRDRTIDNGWGIVIHRQAFINLVNDTMIETGYDAKTVEQSLRRYFNQRETFHFYVDRAVYAIENTFELHTLKKHDLWKKQCGKRLYKYSPIERTASDHFAIKTISPQARLILGTVDKKIIDFLLLTGHISQNSMNIQSSYGTHRELHSWVLSDYLKSGCLINERIVGIENLLGLDNEGLGGKPSIKLSQTDKREQPTLLPVRLYRQ